MKTETQNSYLAADSRRQSLCRNLCLSFQVFNCGLILINHTQTEKSVKFSMKVRKFSILIVAKFTGSLLSY
jgi:hypothetical protein